VSAYVPQRLYSIAILVFIDYWNMVEQPLILLSDETMQPLSVFLSKINSARWAWPSRWHGVHGPDAFIVPPRRGVSGGRDHVFGVGEGLIHFD
jgi:hypothetical protein